MQNVALRTTTGCTQDTYVQHMLEETFIPPIREYMQLHASQFKQKTQHPSHSYTNTQHISPLQGLNTIFNNAQYTTNIPTDTTTETQANMCRIRTSIVSRHLATNYIFKILSIPLPYIISSEVTLPTITRRTFSQLRTNKSPFLKSYLHKVDANSHPSPLCTLCNTNIHNTHHLFHCTHTRIRIVTSEFWTYPVGVTALLAWRMEKLAGAPQEGRWNSTHLTRIIFLYYCPNCVFMES